MVVKENETSPSKAFYFHESNDSLYAYNKIGNVFELYFWFGASANDTVETYKGRYVVDRTEMVYLDKDDSSVFYKKYYLREPPNRFYISRIIADKYFALNYVDDFSDVNKVSGAMEYTCWELKCFSDPKMSEVDLMPYARFGCNQVNQRPIEPPLYHGYWTYSLPRTMPNDLHHFIELRSKRINENNTTYYEVTPYFDRKDVLPDGKINLVSDEKGTLLLHQNQTYRIYDFSLNVGDTGIGHCGPFCQRYLALPNTSNIPTTIKPFKYVVTEVYYDRRDNHPFGGVNKNKMMIVKPVNYTEAEKLIYASWQFNGPIYEGVGCITSLFGEPSINQAIYDTGYLRCFRTDTDLLFAHRKALDMQLGCNKINTDVEDINPEHKPSVYPNPANQELHIDLKSSMHTQATIYNHIGEEVIRVKLKDGVNTIPLAILQEGMYVVRMIDMENNQTHITRFVISR